MNASADFPSPEVKRRIIITKPSNSAWIQFGTPVQPKTQESALRSSAVVDRKSPRDHPQISERSLTQSMLLNGNFKIVSLKELPNKSLAIYRSLSASKKRQEGHTDNQKNISQFEMKYSFLQGSPMPRHFVKMEKGTKGLIILSYKRN
jgi:hypothetical protein